MVSVTANGQAKQSLPILDRYEEVLIKGGFSSYLTVVSV
jgi:hypothetical protein